MIAIEALSTDNIAYACALTKELKDLGSLRDEVPFVWDYYFGYLLRIMDDKDFYFRLARVDGAYVGGVYGYMQQFSFAPVRFGLEHGWYVREGTPSRAKIGMMLMKGFVQWCYDNGAVMVQSGDIAGIGTVGVDALYKRMGFERYGTIYRNKR